MYGQHYGPVLGPDGSELGRAWTFVDPDRSAGYVVYRTSKAARVAQLQLTQGGPGVFRLTSWSDHVLEDLFRIPDEHRVDLSFRVTADVHLQADRTFQGTFETNAGLKGQCTLHSLVPQPTPPDLTITSWAEFRQWMDQPGTEQCIYRGQSAPFPLVTSFHRTGRVNLLRYLQNDLRIFADYLSTTAGQRFDYENMVDRGALVGFAQHHGFPSPMLDWTHSPYVAAFFAFSGVIEKAVGDSSVRVFKLTEEFTRAYPMTGDTIMALSLQPALEQFRPASMGNARLLTQQGVMLFTNVPAPEQFIRYLEGATEPRKKYLEVVDLPSSLCRAALADLRRMGISAASMFPGMDGIGQALKHELFYSPQ